MILPFDMVARLRPDQSIRCCEDCETIWTDVPSCFLCGQEGIVAVRPLREGERVLARCDQDAVTRLTEHGDRLVAIDRDLIVPFLRVASEDVLQ